MSIRLVPRMISGPLDTRLYRIVHAVIAPVVKTIFRMRITGLENLPKDGPIVLASNHVTNADPVFVGVACPRMVHFMAKAEIWKVPLLGRLVSRVGAFPVRRGGADREAVRTALRILKGGAVMGMFPEGRRQKLGKLGQPQPGVGLFSLSEGVTTIPVALKGTNRILCDWRSPLPRVDVHFGPPVKAALKDLTRRERNSEFSHAIMRALAELLEVEWSPESFSAGEPAAKMDTGQGMFPEGRRQKLGKLGQPQPGVGLFSLSEGVTTIPVALKGTNRI